MKMLLLKNTMLITAIALPLVFTGCGKSTNNVPKETKQEQTTQPQVGTIDVAPKTPIDATQIVTPFPDEDYALYANEDVIKGEPLQDIRFLMGTVCRIKIHENPRPEILELAFKRIADIEKKMSMNEDGTEVDAINANAGIKPVKVSKDTFDVVKRGLFYSETSEGSYDITIGPLVKLWHIGFDDARIPSQAEIDEKIKLINYKNVEINEAERTVYLKEKGMMIDLGSIAKGFTADAVAKVMHENKAGSGIIDLGGNVFVVGNKEGEDWTIGIQDPNKERDELVGRVYGQEKSYVTSGVYERFIEAPDGKKYHHILNPKTGYPYDTVIEGVTIISKESIDGDGLSTTVFTKDLVGGMKFIEGVEGAGAIFITDGNKIYLAGSAREGFELLNEDYTIMN